MISILIIIIINIMILIIFVIIITIIITITIILPFIFLCIFRYSQRLQSKIIFNNNSIRSSDSNFQIPLQYKNASSFYLFNNDDEDDYYEATTKVNNNRRKKNENVRLGVWHIPPQNSLTEVISSLNNQHREELKSRNEFDDNKLVILFAHGTGSDRRDSRDLYRMATGSSAGQFLDAHVVSFDYRGFGDSTNVRPTSDGIVSDTRTVLDWLIYSKLVHPSRIVLWGASMGTAVMLQLLAQLSNRKKTIESKLKDIKTSKKKESEYYPLATILEAPFTTLPELLWEHYPFSSSSFNNKNNTDNNKHIINRTIETLFIRKMFHHMIVVPIANNPALNFWNISNDISATDNQQCPVSLLLSQIYCPLLILHAEDDSIVPVRLGKKLYEIARREQPSEIGKHTMFYKFESEKKWNHYFMQKDPHLYQVIGEFINTIKQQQNRIEERI